jgi:hypothetical protein
MPHPGGKPARLDVGAAYMQDGYAKVGVVFALAKLVGKTNDSAAVTGETQYGTVCAHL